MKPLTIHALLRAYRDVPAVKQDAVAMVLVKLAQMAADIPEIREFDVNPLARFIVKFGEFVAKPSEANRKAAADAFTEARNKAEGRSTKNAIERIRAVVEPRLSSR